MDKGHAEIPAALGPNYQGRVACVAFLCTFFESPAYQVQQEL
jgi:hypothetical protein